MSGPLTEEAIGDLIALVQPTKAASLQPLWLVVELSSSGVVQKAVVCYPVYSRAGGFMVAVPAVEEVKEFLEAVSGGDDGEAAYHQVEVDLVTNRGRVLGKVDCLLVDMAWGFLGHLQRVPRGASAPQFEVAQFTCGGLIGKPSVGSVHIAADAWILQGMDEATAQDYYTGEELDPQAEADQVELVPDLEEAPGSTAQDVAALVQQVEQLKQELAQSRSQQVGVQGRQGADVVVTPSKARPLFTGPRMQQQINPADWAKLHQLAGPPPTRGARAGVGLGQTVPPPMTPGKDAKDSFLLELERGATEAAEAEQQLVVQGATSMEQLLMTQIQQNSLLLQKLVGGKPADPLMAALSGSDNGSGSSSGVKGCVARETYLRSIQDLVGIAEVVKQNAMSELGMTADREDSSIMRRFVERKMALADHKTLGYVATLAAEGWAVAHETSNLPMMGFLSKLLMFLEQTCLDRGRTQLAWLLTGCADPAFNLHHGLKSHSSLKPFSTLARASWVSANIAYMKDLDYLEGRMATIGRIQKPGKEDDPDVLDVAPKNPKPKKKGRGKGKDSQAESTSA